jgi:hypothetical protein
MMIIGNYDCPRVANQIKYSAISNIKEFMAFHDSGGFPVFELSTMMGMYIRNPALQLGERIERPTL